MAFVFDEYMRFVRVFHQAEKNWYFWLRDFLLGQAEKVLSIVIPNTPVVTGKLRDGWEIESIVVEGTTLKCYIVNPVEYASFIEYGHRVRTKKAGVLSWATGRFMLTMAIEEVMREMPMEFEIEFANFLASNGLE